VTGLDAMRRTVSMFYCI